MGGFMFKKVFEKLFSKRIDENERLYKVVYHQKSNSYYTKTLLVTGVSAIEAVKQFYKMAGVNDVSDIVEFTEIKFGNNEKTDVEKENSNGI
jgi:hypothetical protein